MLTVETVLKTRGVISQRLETCSLYWIAMLTKVENDAVAVPSIDIKILCVYIYTHTHVDTHM